MEQNKVLVLILGCRYEPYLSLQQAQKDTWISLKKDIEVFHYFGNNSIDEQKDNDIYLNCNDSLFNVAYKTLMVFKYLLDNNYNFTHIYRTNSSSYVNLELLNKYIRNISTNKYLAGPIGVAHNIKFASGSGYLISRDLVKFLVDNISSINTQLLDDVALGDFLISRNGVDINDIIRIDAYNDNMLYKINKYNINNAFHYRVKSETCDRSFDIRAMHYLHDLLIK